MTQWDGLGPGPREMSVQSPGLPLTPRGFAGEYLTPVGPGCPTCETGKGHLMALMTIKEVTKAQNLA